MILLVTVLMLTVCLSGGRVMGVEETVLLNSG